MPISSDEVRQLNFRIESLERLVTKQLARHSQYPIKSGVEIIRFKISTANCVLKTATATVESRPCGKSIVTGENASTRIVNLVDPIGDQLVGDPNDLIGLEGWASYMEDDSTETCDWEIWHIECDANACVP